MGKLGKQATDLSQVRQNQEQYRGNVLRAIAFAGLVLAFAPKSTAQPLPDRSLGSESSQVIPSVTPDGMIGGATDGTTHHLIQQGAIRSHNLFHSFSHFEIPSGEAVYFANPANITRIFARVTGQSSSQIDGTLGVLGTADLFLLNPQGLSFGPNARLDLGGSFIGTTAQQVQFAENHIFGTTQPELTAPLSLSVPLGLQMGPQPGDIEVQGSGHRLSASDPYLAPYQPAATYTGLQVRPEQTLALLGGNLQLKGGVLQAPGGRIELGAVAQPALIGLQDGPQGWSSNYETSPQLARIEPFGAIELTRQASLETGGLLPGHIHLQGGAISLREGSVIANQNVGPAVAGDIRINASEQLELAELDPALNSTAPPTGNLPIQIRQDNFGTGQGGQILIHAPQVTVQSGSAIATRNYGSGVGGALQVEGKSLEIQGYAAQDPTAFSRIFSTAAGAGPGGALGVSATQIDITDGGLLGAFTFDEGGQGGNVSIESDRITVQGNTPAGIRSGIGANQLSRSGQSGNLTINTRSLDILDGGFVTTTSVAAGDAGDLSVTARESITIRGQSLDPSAADSVLGSDVFRPTPILQQLFGLSGIPSGAGGNLQIQTPRLTLDQGGVIAVTNAGLGPAGNLQLKADNILLRDKGTISGVTASGDGGNLAIAAQRLLLIDQSTLSAAASGEDNSGNGGNISIKTSVLLGANNSDILASAQQGDGGNIAISTQGLFGFQFRPQPTPDNDLNASSNLGINGTVQVEVLAVNPVASLIQLEENPVNANQMIALGCDQVEQSQFTLSGNGGLPSAPTLQLQPKGLWRDPRRARSPQALSPHQAQRLRSTHRSQTRSALPTPAEATHWQQLSNGQVQLLAVGNPINSSLATKTC